MGMLYELDEVEKAALLDLVADRARADLNDGRPLTEMQGADFTNSEKDALAQTRAAIDPAHFARIQTAVRDTGKVVSVATVRAAVADVLDAGCPTPNSAAASWLFFLNESEHQTEQRARFIDAIAARIVELQQPPDSFDTELLARLTSARDEYKRGYAAGWEDAKGKENLSDED